MKKLLSAFIGILILCLLLAGGDYALNRHNNGSSRKTVTIYNWGDYIDPALITKFEHQTGYHVDYETFDSNESMLTKIRQGGTNYDLVIPSEYTVQRMRREHLIAPLDHRKLPNMRYLDKQFLNRSFDPGNHYSVPYFWGTLGIIYNDQKIKGADVQHWRQLWNPRLKNNLMLIDSARDVFAIALITQGKSVNTTNYGQLKSAQGKLKQLTPNVKAIIADEMKMYMERGEAAVGVTYSGDAREMMSVNHHLHYVVPSEGSNIWFDNMVIPKSARNKAAAYKFINFMLEPKNAAQNARYVGYATPNWKAKQLLPKKVTSNRAFYPPKQTMKHLQTYRDLPLHVLGEYNDLFLEFKMFAK
ncbi:ABC transporter substrate-binding protein [Limosilactobacillus kribbianus]|uniref:ABC transporter substrate-binding protein n=1 Tax=Limosilactobacillus kribbianus TaxID=2982695 RepID=UPI002263B037|nr:ABC transporter substrate-binding protein [Limosilactobacillus kribbianus]